MVPGTCMLLKRKCSYILSLIVLSACLGSQPGVEVREAQAAETESSGVVRVTNRVLRPAELVPPLGFNHFGGAGALNYAQNNIISSPGNEPMYSRDLYRVTKTDGKRFEIDGGGADAFKLWASGFLSGADVQIYRIVDEAGRPLKTKDDRGHLDTSNAKKAIYVGSGQIIPRGTPGFPDGGHVANRYVAIHPHANVNGLSSKIIDYKGLEPNRKYYYRLIALAGNKKKSVPSAEVSVAIRTGRASPPVLMPPNGEDNLPAWTPSRSWSWRPNVAGGTKPYKFNAFQLDGKTPIRTLGVDIDTKTGKLSGILKRVAHKGFVVEVTDANGLSSRRIYQFPGSKPTNAVLEPAPPTNLKAYSKNGVVYLSWTPSKSENVTGYRVERSTAPLSSQDSALYLDKKSPKLVDGDYLVIEKKYIDFDMRGVSPRVRGIGNPSDTPNWHWRTYGDISLSLDQHKSSLPEGMLGGETALKVVTEKNGGQLYQAVAAGSGVANDYWYGHFEAGKRYRWEGWLRAESLPKNAVTLTFEPGFSITKKISVGDKWKKFQWDFKAPKEKSGVMHFGPKIKVNRPGTLWLDDMRLYQLDDTSGDNPRYIAPNLILNEVLRSQPKIGPKGVHRIWVLDRNMTMDSILSWHSNTRIAPNWNTEVRKTEDMTLPMALEFDRLTGDSKKTRMVPWITLQHILHSKEDWHNLIEWLAAPISGGEETKRSRPYAYLRTQQRGNKRPWTDEFEKIYIEFGNETWHNSKIADWIGFAQKYEIHQGDTQYGLFSAYLIDVIKSSPYWKSQGLDKKIEFVLGANYGGRLNKRGPITTGFSGYGEVAISKAPQADSVSHANYAGPKWETGDSQEGTFSEEGLQASLLAWAIGPEPNQARMVEAQKYLKSQGVKYYLTAYEGGPSGYKIPGQGGKEQVEINERYGKSLALAVGVLDTWLGSYKLGWTDQAYLGFSQGTHYSSHTMAEDGYRPHVGWQALRLRNQAGRGALMETKNLGVPQIDFRGKRYDSVSSYAMKDGQRWTVFVLSRSINKTISVALELPFKQAQKITKYRLKGKPAANNRTSLEVPLEELSVDTKQLSSGRMMVEEGKLKPATIIAYVFEGTR